jgi:hypothetical protein
VCFSPTKLTQLDSGTVKVPLRLSERPTKDCSQPFSRDIIPTAGQRTASWSVARSNMDVSAPHLQQWGMK